MSGLASIPFQTRAEFRVSARALTLTTLGLIVLVGAGVRIWALNSVGFNNDEAVYSGQAAALAADPIYSGLFAIFRAHPLLVQFLVSLVYRVGGVDDVTPRLLSIAFGLGGIVLCYATGSLLYGRRAGLIAAAVLALMPYHVMVTRQVLLDGPETTLFLLTIYLLARFVRGHAERWLYAAAFAGGLTVLAKETAILIVAVAGTFALLSPEIRLSARRILISAALFVVAFSPYPAAIVIGRGTNAAQAFLLWQVLRQPNHPWTFYADVLPGAMGPLVLLAGGAGLVLAIRRGRWEDRLIAAWIAVPVAFFELWPVKGFQYLLPIAPAVCILVGYAFARLAGVVPLWAERLTMVAAEHRQRVAAGASALLLVAVLGSVAVPTAQAVSTTTMTGSLAGTGGLPGGRDAGLWIRGHVPQGAAFLCIGPTMANIVEFYGQRLAYGLSVSPNPLRRNPAYDPIVNPDRSLQLNRVQYVAIDIWSAERSAFFESLLRRYVERYHGLLVYQQPAQVRDEHGHVADRIVIQIYEVRP